MRKPRVNKECEIRRTLLYRFYPFPKSFGINNDNKKPAIKAGLKILFCVNYFLDLIINL